MINRVLIRIKVVQLLYSTLLTETRFTLVSRPSGPTKEKRFAYSLYLSNLYLFLKISEYIKSVKKNGIILSDSRFIKKLKHQEEIRFFVETESNESESFSSLVEYLSEKVINSKIYKDYIKNYPDKENDLIWQEIYKNIILPDERYQQTLTQFQNYTLKGVERSNEMIEETFVKFLATKDNINDNLKLLQKSLEKSRELYIRLLLLPIDITFLREQQLDEQRHKYIVTSEDLNPNLKFVENKLISLLKEDEELEKYSREHDISWLSEDRDLIQALLKDIMESEIYKKYMDSAQDSKASDCEFWRDIYKNLLFENSHFLEYMENKSVFWNDDLDIIGTFVIKTFKKFEDKNSNLSPVLPMFKDGPDGKDANFGKDLFKNVINNKDYYRDLIDIAIEKDKWETERLAFMDIIIMMTALAEIINFPEIPLAASYNEYIEIAKSYSTHKSGSFINGLLHKIVVRLQEEGKILKN